ncbi:DDE-1 domain-containing protein [Nephila pilipes]|uniref:DDE-1 domain-containing protein n=1 Tax=Nephila pilipes TaxID=299642 RepID=A0A8X6NWP6_NEPPI|nr:DDE-1 domain-containing protein [Nephila pilipes]
MIAAGQFQSHSLNKELESFTSLIIDSNKKGVSVTRICDIGTKINTMFAVSFALIFITGNALGSPVANNYVDSVLNTALRNEIKAQNLDPAVLNDFKVEFQDKVSFIGKVKGKADFTNGKLVGLSNAKRFLECQGPYYSFGARNINCTITFNDLKITYDGKLKYGKMPKVNIKGMANVTNIVIFFEATHQNPVMPATLKNFHIQQNGHLNIRFTGLGPLNKYVKFLEDGFKSLTQGNIFNSLSQRYQYALNRAVGMVPFPN